MDKVECVVIGAGVVGLAVARRLAAKRMARRIADVAAREAYVDAECFRRLEDSWIGGQHWRLRGVLAGCDGKGLIADLDETPRSPDRSNLRKAAVDEEFGPVDEATVVGSEENDGFCHLIRSA